MCEERERKKKLCERERERFELFVFEVVFRLLRFRSRQREKMDPGKRSNVNIPVLGGTEPILKT